MTFSLLRQMAILLACLSLTPLFAQKQKKVKFGKIDKAQVEMTEYEADPDAEAVILYEKQRTSFDNGSDGLVITYDVHRRVKILTTSAEDYANVEISYIAYNKNESIVGMKAISHNMEDGQLVSQKMERSAIFNEAVNEFVNTISFAVPNAKEGTVIEYSYRKISKRIGTIPPWYFQHEIPVMHSELSVNLPYGFNYQRMYRGEPIATLTISEETYRPDWMEETGYRYRYVAKDVPAMKEEPYTTSIYNFVGRLQFELQGIHLPRYGIIKDYNTTWRQLDETCQKSSSFSSYLANANYLEKMKTWIGNNDSPDAFLGAAAGYIRANYPWNGNRGIYPSDRLRELEIGEKVNGASMNVLFVGLARMAGFEAYPVLISTRKHGAVQSIYPLLDQFNHTIAKISTEEGYFLVDLTDPFCPLGTLPFADLNSIGLVLDGSGSKWVKVNTNQKFEGETRGNFTLSADGTLDGNLTFIDKGYQAIGWRKEYYSTDEDESAYIKERLLEELPSAEMENLKVENMDSIRNPLKTSCDLVINDYVNATGDYLYIQPMLFETQEENPFKLEERSYPVEFGANISHRTTIVLSLPEGYEIETLPEPTRVVLPEKGASFTYQIQSIGGMVQAMSVLDINQTMFSSEEYPNIRAFYDYVVKKHGEQIVLKKKS